MVIHLIRRGRGHCVECGAPSNAKHIMRHRVHVTVEIHGRDGLVYRARCHEGDCFWSKTFEGLEQAIRYGSSHCEHNNRVAYVA